MSLDLSEAFFSIEEDGGEPALHHLAVAIALYIALYIPHRGKHALNRIGRMQGLPQEGGDLQSGGTFRVKSFSLQIAPFCAMVCTWHVHFE